MSFEILYHLLTEAVLVAHTSITVQNRQSVQKYRNSFGSKNGLPEIDTVLM